MTLEAYVSDTELVESFRAGDREAFGELYERYFPKLEKYVRRGFHYLDAEDVVQSSFVNAMRWINSYDSERDFARWIYRVTRNQAMRMSRKERKTKSKETQLDNASHISIETLSPLEKLESREERIKRRLEDRSAWMIIRRGLGEKYGAAVRLIYVEGLSYEAAAREIGVSTANMKVMMYRMRKRVREALQEEGYEFQNGN